MEPGDFVLALIRARRLAYRNASCSLQRSHGHIAGRVAAPLSAAETRNEVRATFPLTPFTIQNHAQVERSVERLRNKAAYTRNEIVETRTEKGQRLSVWARLNALSLP